MLEGRVPHELPNPPAEKESAMPTATGTARPIATKPNSRSPCYDTLEPVCAEIDVERDDRRCDELGECQRNVRDALPSAHLQPRAAEGARPPAMMLSRNAQNEQELPLPVERW